MNRNYLNFSQKIEIPDQRLTQTMYNGPGSTRGVRSPHQDRTGRSFSARTCPPNFLMSSTMKTQPLKDQFAELTDLIHHFANDCHISETNPELINQFTRVDRQYNYFIQQSTSIFNSINTSGSPRVTLKTTAINKVAQDLIKEWQDFIGKMNEAEEMGVAPIYKLLGDKLLQISKTLSFLSSVFDHPQNNVSIGNVKKSKFHVEQIRKEARRLVKMSAAYQGVEFDEETFENRLTAFDSSISSLFSDALPRNLMLGNGLLTMKRDLKFESVQIVQIYQGILDFDQIVDNIRDSIVATNGEFDSVFHMLGLQYKMTLVFNDDVNTNETKNTTPVEKSNIKCMNRIRDKLSEIENAITQTPLTK